MGISGSNTHRQVNKDASESKNSHYTSPENNNTCLYHTEVSTLNITKLHHPKNEHLNANVKNCQYVFPKFFSLY